MDMVNHCSICGCDVEKAHLSADKCDFQLAPGKFVRMFPNTHTYITSVLCSTCTEKMDEYMKLLRDTSNTANKPKRCIICDSEHTEITCDIDAYDNERWKVHCNDCDTSFSNDNKDWSEKETLKWWNELKR